MLNSDREKNDYQIISQSIITKAERPLWVVSSRSECDDLVNLNVAYRPIAVIQQQYKNPALGGAS
jgi:hypothetical protein